MGGPYEKELLKGLLTDYERFVTNHQQRILKLDQSIQLEKKQHMQSPPMSKSVLLKIDDLHSAGKTVLSSMSHRPLF